MNLATAKKELVAVGRYVKATDPGMIERMREFGEPTNAQAVGGYVLGCDPEMFDHILDNLAEDER